MIVDAAGLDWVAALWFVVFLGCLWLLWAVSP